jgi:hypothetical protein
VRSPDRNRVGNRSSRKLYPLLGLALNVTVLMIFLALALLGAMMNAA